MKKKNPTILALYPNTYGVGYAVFDSPKDLVDCGIGHIRPKLNSKVYERISHYVDYYMPDVVLVRGKIEGTKKQVNRIEKLIDHICKQISLRNLEIHTYTKSQIAHVFSEFNVGNTKYHRSKKMLEWFPQLEAREFPLRKSWEAESVDTSVFDAVALGITHFYLQ